MPETLTAICKDFVSFVLTEILQLNFCLQTILGIGTDMHPEGEELMMKYGLLLTLALTTCVFAQDRDSAKAQRNSNAGQVGLTWRSGTAMRAPVLNEPCSATVAIENIQTLPDGNRIVQHLTGDFARDSQGRTRTNVPRPASTEKAPHMVLIQDPVTKTSYALNFTKKTAMKITVPSETADAGNRPDPVDGGSGFIMQMGNVTTAGPESPMSVSFRTGQRTNEKVSKEDLGSKTMEGLLVNGTRTTRTIPAEQIGNAKPITIVTETWTSPDLKTVVYRKSTNPLVGQEIYQLTNINRSEPDPSLFTVPADFRVVNGPRGMVIRRSGSEN